MERVEKKTEKPDVVLDEDKDHFYLNGVGVKENAKGRLKNKVAFWNCNGWGGDSHGGTEKTLGEMAAMEDVEMLCITDTRLDNYMGLRVQGMACNELKKYTGKTWVGHLVNRREDGRIGGRSYSTRSDGRESR